MLSGLPEGPGKLRFKTQAPTELLLELGRSRSAEWRFWEQLLYWPALGVRAWGRFAWLPPPHAPSAWPLPHAPSAWPPPLAPPPPRPLCLAPLPNASLGGPSQPLAQPGHWPCLVSKFGTCGRRIHRRGPRPDGGEGRPGGPCTVLSLGPWSLDPSVTGEGMLACVCSGISLEPAGAGQGQCHQLSSC